MSDPSRTPSPARPASAAGAAVPDDRERRVPPNFLTEILDEDLRSGRVTEIVTRFPPEPNGYAHIGHAIASFLNFGLARDYGGRCRLRFDDTNPEVERMEYVRSIEEDMRWLGWRWEGETRFASDYFERLYELALRLVERGDAYVDSLSTSEIQAYRGTVDTPGRPSPYRERSVEENLDLFRRMRAGEFAPGEHVLRAKIDMASPNMKMRDPLLYRIVDAAHYRTGESWPIYPFYDFQHPLSDAIEGVTHSLCSLEFVDNREIYDWLVERLFDEPRPRQYEFGRRSLEYTVVSKRKLIALVQGGHVDGWDDPRMPTLAGLRRRGVRPEALRAFAARVGISRTNRTVDLALLEHAVRDDLNAVAPRVMAVLEPLRVVLTNVPEDADERLRASYWPPDVDREGEREVPFGRELWIERGDFAEEPPKGWRRLAPGWAVRLRHAHVIVCDEVVRDDAGEVAELRCRVLPDSLGQNPEGVKVRGAIHWLAARTALPAEFRLYDRLFTAPDPDAGEGGFLANLNPDSLVVRRGFVEPSVAADAPGTRYQFERLGYFWPDPTAADGARDRPRVFSRIVTLKDSWSRRSETKDASEAPKEREAAAPQRAPARAGTEPDPVDALDADGRTRFERLREHFALGRVDAALIAADADLTAFFEAAVHEHGSPAAIANWIVNELQRELKQRSVLELPFGPEHLAGLVRLVDDGTITAPAAKEVLEHLLVHGGDPREVVRSRGLEQLRDPAQVEAVVDEILAANPEQVEAYRGGKTGLRGYFVGQTMRATKGRADPQLVQRIVGEKLDA